jgi:hypothetical protein
MRSTLSNRKLLGMALALLVGGCTTYWTPGPNAQGTFQQANARCRLLARGLHQDPDYIPSSNRALSNTAYAIGIVGSIAQDEVNSRDCMEASGWERVRDNSPSAPTPVALTEAQPRPIPIPAAASISANPSSPAPAAAIPSPTLDGQVVLFPVTIYNSYHPHWTVGAQ